LLICRHHLQRNADEICIEKRFAPIRYQNLHKSVIVKIFCEEKEILKIFAEEDIEFVTPVDFGLYWKDIPDDMRKKIVQGNLGSSVLAALHLAISRSKEERAQELLEKLGELVARDPDSPEGQNAAKRMEEISEKYPDTKPDKDDWIDIDFDKVEIKWSYQIIPKHESFEILIVVPDQTITVTGSYEGQPDNTENYDWIDFDTTIDIQDVKTDDVSFTGTIRPKSLEYSSFVGYSGIKSGWELFF